MKKRYSISLDISLDPKESKGHQAFSISTKRLVRVDTILFRTLKSCRPKTIAQALHAIYYTANTTLEEKVYMQWRFAHEIYTQGWSKLVTQINKEFKK